MDVSGFLKHKTQCGFPVNEQSVRWIIGEVFQLTEVVRLVSLPNGKHENGKLEVTLNSTNCGLSSLSLPLKRILLYSLARMIGRDTSLFDFYLFHMDTVSEGVPHMFFVYRCIQLVYEDKHRVYAAAGRF
jgi:hypothetical protein